MKSAQWREDSSLSPSSLEVCFSSEVRCKREMLNGEMLNSWMNLQTLWTPDGNQIQDFLWGKDEEHPQFLFSNLVTGSHIYSTVTVVSKSLTYPSFSHIVTSPAPCIPILHPCPRGPQTFPPAPVPCHSRSSHSLVPWNRPFHQLTFPQPHTHLLLWSAWQYIYHLISTNYFPTLCRIVNYGFAFKVPSSEPETDRAQDLFQWFLVTCSWPAYQVCPHGHCLK